MYLTHNCIQNSVHIGNNFQVFGRTVTYDASLTRKPMKIMFSISPFYCRGLIYQARAGRFTHGFDESNREASTIEFLLRRTFIFMTAKNETQKQGM
jgi:hypothetical protein